jgi:hypothetical protein
MGVLKYIEDHPNVVERVASKVSIEELARQRRLAKMLKAEGLWKNRTDIPKDGVAYQEELRAE